MILVSKVAILEIYSNLSKFWYVFQYSEHTFTHMYTQIYAHINSLQTTFPKIKCAQRFVVY